MVALGFSNRPPFQNGSNKSKITFDDIALKVQSGIISKTKRAALGQLFIYAAKIYLKSHGTTKFYILRCKKGKCLQQIWKIQIAVSIFLYIDFGSDWIRTTCDCVGNIKPILFES